ncbi:TetR family transcriptional regulator [Aeromicrobium sp. Root495]|uniref:TetR/AcrR family transcriptional regulator n=1 Tax=Aeromicrobium sp. Root495 TaxID=1736550 RepID=UPI0006F50D58|nr:TetR/AcrR family transcriptional regulator [Aeromicrobium sp. Root495]KQY55280.1 TetR family transcriptional regulator [Aeromicrobium sp. Root495]
MPRNRRPRDREEKSAEIVAAATSLFSEEGYEKTSLAGIAAAAGVTTNTIYWYFQDKDALFVAVLDGLLRDGLAGVEDLEDRPWVEQLLWVVDELRRFDKLVTAVHALAADSPAIDAWHEGFHALADTMLAEILTSAGVPEAQVAARTRLGVFAVEGLLMHELPRAEQRQVLELVVEGAR